MAVWNNRQLEIVSRTALVGKHKHAEFKSPQAAVLGTAKKRELELPACRTFGNLKVCAAFLTLPKKNNETNKQKIQEEKEKRGKKHA